MSGELAGAEGFVTEVEQETIQKIEKNLKRRFAVGSQVRFSPLTSYFCPRWPDFVQLADHISYETRGLPNFIRNNVTFLRLFFLFSTIFQIVSCKMQHEEPLGADVCLSVCMCGSISFFLPFTQKIFRQPIPENLWPKPIFFADAPMKKK